MHNPFPHRLLADARPEDLGRAAARRRLAREPGGSRRRASAAGAVTLRYAFPDDEQALLRLAALDSADLPTAPVLLAEVGGALRAALSLQDDRAIADPFHHTEWLLVLLRARAVQLSTGEFRQRRLHRLASRLGLSGALARPESDRLL